MIVSQRNDRVCHAELEPKITALLTPLGRNGLTDREISEILQIEYDLCRSIRKGLSSKGILVVVGNKPTKGKPAAMWAMASAFASSKDPGETVTLKLPEHTDRDFSAFSGWNGATAQVSLDAAESILPIPHRSNLEPLIVEPIPTEPGRQIARMQPGKDLKSFVKEKHKKNAPGCKACRTLQPDLLKEIARAVHSPDLKVSAVDIHEWLKSECQIELSVDSLRKHVKHVEAGN